MASQGLEALELSEEAQSIMELIDQGSNFLLSGGAGSGKTYSLVEVIRAVIHAKPIATIACITYTNAAVQEIESRVDHPNLHVSTIHEFLWHNIKHFQAELQDTIIELINDEDELRFKKDDAVDVDRSFFENLENGIQYKEFVRIKHGIISHDELIIVAHKMYAKYQKLCAITKDTYPYIFLDEYQDTDKKVVEILLLHLKKSEKNNVVGFFGDAMQSIYEGSVGNLDAYKESTHPQIQEVQKVQNRRNPLSIINLANLLRNDGLTQIASDDVLAPNMNPKGKVKDGSVLFLYSSDDDLSRVRNNLGWDFTDSKHTKELNLTHNLIANKAGFEGFMRIYDGDKILGYVKRLKAYIKNNSIVINTEGKTLEDVMSELQNGKSGSALSAVSPTNGMKEYISRYPANYQAALRYPYDEISSIYIDKDQLIDDKKNDTEDPGKVSSNRDDLIKHLFSIQHNIRLYQEKRFNEFIKHTDFNISSQEDKVRLKSIIEAFIQVGGKSVEQIIDEADTNNIVKIGDQLQFFKERKRYVYQQVAELPFSQFQKLYEYLEGFTPFSTQHKTKGAEFKNVFVILDDGRWNHYNFENLFTGQGNVSVLHRTQKIFYVCCTRTKESLAVFYHEPSTEVINKAKEWFGSENVINLD